MPDITELRIEPTTGSLTATPLTVQTDPSTLYTAPGVTISQDEIVLRTVDGINEGTGENILIGVDGSADRIFKFKTLRADTGILLTHTDTEIAIKSLASVSVDLNTASGILPVSKGGTGLSTNVTNGILIGNGTSSSYISPPQTTTILSWDNTAQTFKWIPIPSGGGTTIEKTTVTGTLPILVSPLNDNYDVSLDVSKISINELSNNLSVAKGGTGRQTFTMNSVILGNGSSGLKEVQSSTGFLYYDGTSHSWKTETGTVSSVSITSSNSDLTVSQQTITTSGTIDLKLSDTGVLAGSYQNPNITVDFKGRITQISSGSTNGSSSAINLGMLGESVYAGTQNGSLAFKKLTSTSDIILSSQPESISIGINTIGILKGGTGISHVGSPGQSIRVNSTSTAFEYYTPTNSGGSVTSVGITAGSNKISTTGSPITSSGSIAIDINEQNLSHSNIGGIVPISKGGTGVSTLPSGILVSTATSLISIPQPTEPGQLTFNGTSYEWASLQNSSVPTNVVKIFTFTVNYNAGALAPTSVSDLPTGWDAVISGQDIIVTHNVGKQPIFLTMMGLDTAAVPNTFKMMYPTSTNPMVIPESSTGSKSPSITQFKFRATTSATGATSGMAASLAKIQITF